MHPACVSTVVELHELLVINLQVSSRETVALALVGRPGRADRGVVIAWYGVSDGALASYLAS